MERPANGIDPVADVRRLSMDHAAFAFFVRRAVDQAKTQRGWTVNRLATETGVGRSTLFRWLAGDGQEFPELANVRGFCAALGIPVSAAFTALGVRETPGGIEDTTLPPGRGERDARDNMRRILDRLGDPRISAAEKSMIRDMLSYLAGDRARAAAG